MSLATLKGHNYTCLKACYQCKKEKRISVHYCWHEKGHKGKHVCYPHDATKWNEVNGIMSICRSVCDQHPHNVCNKSANHNGPCGCGKDEKFGSLIAKRCEKMCGACTKNCSLANGHRGEDLCHSCLEGVNNANKKSRQNSLVRPQKAPNKKNTKAIWPIVIKDMEDRDKFGREKYGVPLHAEDGRDTLQDAYQESLDLAVYIRKLIFERDGK